MASHDVTRVTVNARSTAPAGRPATGKGEAMIDEQGRAEIDLDMFCCREPHASGSDLSVPFSLNGHTYATNGHICVRVPRRPDIPENMEARTPKGACPGIYSHASSWGRCPSPSSYPTKAGSVVVGAISTNAPVAFVNANFATEAANSRHASESARLFSLLSTSNGYRIFQGWRLESQSLKFRYRFGSRAARVCSCPWGVGKWLPIASRYTRTQRFCARGERISRQGPSGQGKSDLMMVLQRHPEGGPKVELNGNNP
jgi:hypothetical protein